MLWVLKKDKYEATLKSWNQAWLELNGSSGPIQLTVKGVESHSGDAVYSGCHAWLIRSSAGTRAQVFPSVQRWGAHVCSQTQ